MNAKKPIVVRIDGKQAKEKLNKERNSNFKVVEEFGTEEAAAIEESGENKIHTFAREYDAPIKLSKTAIKKQSNLNMFKPIIIAIISAITIGSVMGFVMLKIIVNFDNDLNSTPAYSITGQEKDDNDKGTSDDLASDSTLYSFDSMSAFVLQGGVFSSASGAEAESRKFDEQGYTPVIWEKDSQFFLLISSALSKEDLQGDINSLVNSGIDVYAKEWIIGEKEVMLTEEESTWVSSFQDQWNIAMGKGSIEADTWNKLIEQAPKGTESFNSFVKSVEEQINSFNDGNMGQILLAMWMSYDVFLSAE